MTEWKHQAWGPEGPMTQKEYDITIGHNKGPDAADLAKAQTVDINSWLTDNPTIESEEKAREAKLLIDRGKLTIKDLEDEREKRVRPLNQQVQEINGYYRGPRELLRRVTDEITRRITTYLTKEEAKRIKIAEEARKKAEEAERLAREAEQRERDTKSDADSGVVVDVAVASQQADEAFSAYQRAERQAAVSEKDSKVRVGGGFTRALSLRDKETLVIVDAIAAINAIGIGPDLEAAILKSARSFRAFHGELPPGVISKIERGV